ncbi:uncharacterized protein OCT59_008412 [Rhizophagus irregularis]|uniref:uncharacterized protein n=1 Tax=Rhizophagus irregularis TaxID=588596 RepID=UPI00331B8E97|nr:hypothetical protein OCT59_008412 [Rhizophagus irregularis]
MDEIKLSNDVIEQIEDFDHYLLTEEQKLLIDKLITDKELKERYKKNGLCRNCKQPNIDYYYCRSTKGGFGTTFKAVWKDGPWKINYDNNQLERKGKTGVALKCLHNSQDITADFLKEVESNILEYDSCWIVRCFDPLKRPNANELHESIWKLYEGISYNKVDSVICEQVKEADETNKKSSSSVQSPISSTSTLSYMTHPQAVYISRLLNFKNLPEPINADNEDLEYSDSLRMDFTKLDINSKDERN